MTFVIIVVVVILAFIIFMKTSVNGERDKEVAKDVLLTKGLSFKYPDLFEFFQSELHFNLVKQDKLSFLLAKNIYEYNLSLRMEFIYQNNHRLQVIMQAYKITPSSHISTKSYFYSSFTDEVVLINKVGESISQFLSSVVHNKKTPVTIENTSPIRQPKDEISSYASFDDLPYLESEFLCVNCTNNFKLSNFKARYRFKDGTHQHEWNYQCQKCGRIKSGESEMGCQNSLDENCYCGGEFRRDRILFCEDCKHSSFLSR